MTAEEILAVYKHIGLEAEAKVALEILGETNRNGK